MSHISRRLFLATTLAAGLAASSVVWAAEPTEIAVWPGAAPGSDKVKLDEMVELVAPNGSYTGVSKPVLIIYRPEGPPTAAVMVVPGGGFSSIAAEHEGHEIARWLAKNGIAAGILIYRLPNDGWPADAMVQDAQRAMRVLRKEIGAPRTGVLGFSAGGTIAAALDARAEEPLYTFVDDLDRTSAKPDFVGLGYAFLNVPKPQSSRGFNGFAKTPAPTFIFHAADDKRVGVKNSHEAYAAVLKAKGQAQIHIFPTGGHGFALRRGPAEPAAAWPKLFLDWLKALPAA